MPSSRLDDILDRLHAAERDLADELDRLVSRNQARFRYTLRRGKVRFEHGIRALQREHRIGMFAYLKQAPLRHIATAPVIYGMIFPLALLDLTITVYQHSCFRAYGIPRVRRRDHLAIDRHQLAYLNAIEKLNCVYCGYGNGVIGYAREIVARTEQFWCPIKHARRVAGEHERTSRFVAYGDAEAYRSRLEALRHDWDEQVASDSDTVQRPPH